ncbi:MAG: phytanoyl-CoA dioxygenase family protein [Gammaproteobacteria bacterium]
MEAAIELQEGISPAPVRAITPAEVAHYREHGWAKLGQFLKPWVVEGLLERARDRMGDDPMTVSREAPTMRTENEFGWYARWDGCSHQDPWIRSIGQSKEYARAATAFLGAPVRFYFDHVFVKRPARNDGVATPWHQDLPHHPLDRQGVLTIWTALVTCTPDMGTMRFLSGSHRAGLLGRYLNRRDGINLIDENPWVLEQYQMSPPVTLQPGDATIHNLAVVHYAPENAQADPRWVYSTQWLPVNTRYTGAPNHRTDNLGLKIDQPLDHPRFPIIPV